MAQGVAKRTGVIRKLFCPPPPTPPIFFGSLLAFSGPRCTEEFVPHGCLKKRYDVMFSTNPKTSKTSSFPVWGWSGYGGRVRWSS